MSPFSMLGLGRSISGWTPRQKLVKNWPGQLLPSQPAFLRWEICKGTLKLEELFTISLSLYSGSGFLPVGKSGNCIMKFAFEMCHASNMFHIFQGIIPDITVCLEVSLKTGKEIQRIFAASSRLILIQHNRVFCIASGCNGSLPHLLIS